MKECGLTECELWAPQIEPPSSFGRGRPTPEQAQQAREAAKTWRLETPLDHFRAIRKKFESAGMTIYAFNYSPNNSFTDAEIDRGFEMAKALGAEIITASATIEAARRMAPFAAKHKMPVAMHNHSNVTDPNEFATLESLATALTAVAATSGSISTSVTSRRPTTTPWPTSASTTPASRTCTSRIARRTRVDNTAWGTGDTPIRQVLQLLKTGALADSRLHRIRAQR